MKKVLFVHYGNHPLRFHIRALAERFEVIEVEYDNACRLAKKMHLEDDLDLLIICLDTPTEEKSHPLIDLFDVFAEELIRSVPIIFGAVTNTYRQEEFGFERDEKVCFVHFIEVLPPVFAEFAEKQLENDLKVS